MSDEECEKYGVSRDYADNVVSVIRGFAEDLYNKKLDGTLLNSEKSFPQKAMIYNRKFTSSN